MITDGIFICGLCGEDLTGCFLCGKGGAPLIDMRPQLEKERMEADRADTEMRAQERAIRRGAEERRRNG